MSAYAAQMASTALAIAAVIVVWKSRCTTEIKAAALVVAAFLATPYVWDYDMIVLLFASAWVARDGLRSGYLPDEKIMIIALLVLPLPMMLVGTFLQLQVGPLVLWLMLLLLLRRCRVFQSIPGPVLPRGDLSGRASPAPR